MAQPVAPGELGSWRGENVRLSQVIDALGGLRRGGQRTATRASVTNLVLVAADDDEVERACDAVHRLGRRHPGRNIVVLPRPGARPDGIDASVLLHGSVAEGRPVWSEDIRLQVRGAPAEHLASLVEPLTLPDLPVVVWFVRGVPEPGDALVRAADSVVVDSGTLGADALAAGVAALARLARRRVALDLCWARLLPLRQLLAAQFDAPAVAPYASRVHRAEVGGPPAARLLLAGWLVARLGLAPPALSFSDAPSPAVRLAAGAAGDAAEVSVEEVGAAAGAVVRATARLAGAPAREDRVALPEDPLAWSLGEALTRRGRDRVYGQALHAAVDLVEPATDWRA